MIDKPRYKSLLRKVYVAIIGSNLSAKELRDVAEELRMGQFPDELAYLIGSASSHFTDFNPYASDEVENLEALVKERKITKAGLISVIRSISPQPNLGTSLSIRQIIVRFIDRATSRETEKLRDVLKSAVAPDPFLKGITDKTR